MASPHDGYPKALAFRLAYFTILRWILKVHPFPDYGIMRTMKKIFWAIQNLDCIGGTETVSIQLMNLLCDTYEIHLICTSKQEGKSAYFIDPRIQIHNLEIPSEVGRFDQCWAVYDGKGRRRLLKETLSSYVFHRNKTRKLIASWIDEDSIYIGSALDSYLLAPKHKHVYYHFHFDPENYLACPMQMVFRHCSKPEKIIFLAKHVKEEVLKKKKKLSAKATYIYNPAKFQPQKDIAFHGGKILFVGRFTEQKDPMLALEIAKLLHEDSVSFHLTMYGEGHLEQAMREFVQSNRLSEVSIITGHSTTQEDYFASDFLLCTSTYEGWCLVKAEANACSRPVMTTHWDGPVEEVFDEKTDGWLMPSRDPKEFAKKIKEILSNPDQLLLQQEKAFEGSKRISNESIKKAWVDLLG